MRLAERRTYVTKAVIFVEVKQLFVLSEKTAVYLEWGDRLLQVTSSIDRNDDEGEGKGSWAIGQPRAASGTLTPSRN